MKIITVILACLVVVLSFCKKETTEKKPEIITTELKSGLPEESGAIHGYFYASFDENNALLKAFSVFSDTSSNLMKNYNRFYDASVDYSIPGRFNGNVNNGEVSFNDISLIAKDNVKDVYFYFLYQNSLVDSLDDAHWAMTGSEGFKPLDLQIKRKFPKLKNISAAAQNTLSIQSGYRVYLKDFVLNGDSAIVAIKWVQPIIKRVSGAVASVFFSAAELASLAGTTSVDVSVYVYNYSNRTVENKKHVFELSKRFKKTVQVIP